MAVWKYWKNAGLGCTMFDRDWIETNEWVCLEVIFEDDDLDIADDQEEVPDHY